MCMEYDCTDGGVEFTQANRDDCSRFIYCTFGRATYWQCRRGHCFWTCVPLTSTSSRYECFNAANTQCVIQKERPYDSLQAEPLYDISEVIPASTVPTTRATKQPVFPQFPYGILPGGGVLPPTPLSPYNPYLYGPGLGVSSGGMGFNINLNYNPLLGWSLNSNLALETPWLTMLAPLLGLPPMLPPMPYGPGMGMFNPGMPFPPMFRQLSPSKQSSRSFSRQINAVEVNACVPTDAWPESSTVPATTRKINEIAL